MFKKLKEFSRNDLLQLAGFLFLFFYPFNNTISKNIFFGDYNPFVFTLIGSTILLFAQKNKIRRYELLHFAILALTFIIILVNNNSILLNIRLGTLAVQCMYIALFVLFSAKRISKKAVFCATAFYCIEHIIGTIIPIVAPSFYSQTLLPFICEGSSHCFAYYNFLVGKNAGFTGHYSTNGIYMAISTLLFASHYFRVKDRKSLILGIISLALLFIIGKRAHLVFTILAMAIGAIVMYRSYSLKELISKYAKLFLIVILGIAGFLVATQYIPQLKTTINRFSTQSEDDDILNGRGPLYELAVNEWKKSPVIGNGWGHYVIESNERFGEKTYGTSYIHAHNDFLELLCDVGIVGTLVYVVILARTIISSFKNVRKNNSNYLDIFTFEYMIFFILYSFVGTPISTVSTLCFLILSMAITFNNTRRKEIICVK